MAGKLGTRIATQDNNLNDGGNTNNFLYNLFNKIDDYGSNLDPKKRVISKSHRRKFVHGLSDWGLMSEWISCIVRNYHYFSHHANHKEEQVDFNSNTDMLIDEDILFHDEHEKDDPFYTENVCDVFLWGLITSHVLVRLVSNSIIKFKNQLKIKYQLFQKMILVKSLSW